MVFSKKTKNIQIHRHVKNGINNRILLRNVTCPRKKRVITEAGVFSSLN